MKQLSIITPENIIEKLKQLDGVSEAYQVVFTFKIIRKAKSRHTQEVTIKILDGGSKLEDRYFCRATSNDGTTATGNPQTSIEYAMLHTHWNDLDKTA